ncbi:Aldehyde/histidinol dehydrogenase [Aspergillus bertholletiae]|uniref:Aldehyde/histidinol dehydrogenase n=1 Tax=Aspergillus bertholletiae TaxID=1226010 RepID=A0A5N7B5B6_9EURO|nr:Aldehyde/histidinol dehydrogenase [Aspergillus bertholletiae]
MCRPFEKTIPYEFKDPSLVETRGFIGGKWVAAVSGQTFSVFDPEDDHEIIRVTDIGRVDTVLAIEQAQEAFETYRQMPHRERRWLMRRWGDLIKANADDLAALCTLELGKPFTESAGSVQYAIDFIDWYETAIERTLGETIPAARGNNRILTIRQPQGVVAAITPWNSPLAMVTRKVGAAIAAGNTVICKPAPETPLCALALAKLFERAGGPPGVFNVIPCSLESTPEVGEQLCHHKSIKHLSFTGSTAVGKYLNTECARTIKKTSLELGGNAPFLVFADANLEQAAKGLVASKFRSSGQTCVCANRILVQASVLEPFADVLRKCIDETFVYGSVWDPKVNFGPLYSAKGIDKVKEHVKDALTQGARVHSSGAISNTDKPNFFPPTIIITGSGQGMRFMNEETFGPIAFLIPFETEEEAIKMANESDAGLAAYFYTEDISRVFRVSEALKVGMVGARTGLVSAAEQPFGGIQESGQGREGGIAALEEYLDIKSITIGV